MSDSTNPQQDRSDFRLEPRHLPRPLIPFAKMGPRGLPRLLAENLADLGELGLTWNGLSAVRNPDGFPFLGFYDSPGGPQPGPYEVSDYTPTRTLDASTATVSDVADFICTLVDDLRGIGLLG